MERRCFQDIKPIVVGKDDSRYLDERRQKLDGFFLIMGNDGRFERYCSGSIFFRSCVSLRAGNIWACGLVEFVDMG